MMGPLLTPSPLQEPWLLFLAGKTQPRGANPQNG